MKTILVALLMVTALAVTANAELVTVLKNQNGAFGAPLSGSVVLAGTSISLFANQTYSITATGLVNVGGLSVGPNGTSTERSTLKGPFAEGYTPLEEGIIDGGGSVPTTDSNSIVQNFGALIGVFVSEANFNSPGFSAKNVDSGGSINSTDLFLVGESFNFTTPNSGRLFFGINEGFVSNNSGSFDVTISSVPEPTSFAMLGVTIIGLALRRRKP